MSRVTIAINLDTKLRLMRHMVYGDSFDRAINAILDKIETPPPRTENQADTEQPLVEHGTEGDKQK